MIISHTEILLAVLIGSSPYTLSAGHPDTSQEANQTLEAAEHRGFTTMWQ